MLGAIASDFEARWVAGHAINFRDYIIAVNTQRRSLAALGLETHAAPEEDFYEKLEREAREREAASVKTD